VLTKGIDRSPTGGMSIAYTTISSIAMLFRNQTTRLAAASDFEGRNISLASRCIPQGGPVTLQTAAQPRQLLQLRELGFGLL
jgi:hypothetical protein